MVKNDLIHSGSACRLVRVEEHCSHTGGGSNTSALLNGTTCNGEGSSETVDDGHTFRGYGAADYLVFHLDTAKSKAGYDLTRLLSFAGHSDARASQRYTVSFAFVSAPRHFVKFRPGAVECDGGGSIVRLAGKEGGILDNGAGCRATGVAAVRFDFENGPIGFNCYREFCLVGTPTK